MIAPLVNAGSTLAKQMPDRIVEGGSYIRLSGTSMAAPVVSGVVALMIQKNPKLTNDAIKWILLNNALQLKEVVNGVGTPIKGQGAGVVNATSSVNFTGTPGLANKGIPISEQLVGPNGQTTYQTCDLEHLHLEHLHLEHLHLEHLHLEHQHMEHQQLVNQRQYVERPGRVTDPRTRPTSRAREHMLPGLCACSQC